VDPLVDDAQFKQLLKDAGKNDPVMRQVQDVFFDKRYFQPAMDWADHDGFTLPLSALVIYDSQVHSGGILGFLRKRFAETAPASGGDEKTWIKQYVDVRQSWLANHSNPDLRKTIYRTQCFEREIGRNNWDLSQLPINANGVNVAA
jgi:chitosanase